MVPRTLVLEPPAPAQGRPPVAGPRGGKHLSAVDGLRAFAVLVVLVFHLKNSALPGGFTGVDVFFVISGYVVSLALLSHSAERLTSFFSAFYLRRTARIYPALAVMLLTTVVLSCLFIPRGFLSNANEGVGSLAFWGVSNWGLVNLGDNYFSPTTDFNPYAHTWSLAVEEQFYLVFSPIFFLGVQAIRNPRYRRAAFILPALCVASFVYSAWVSLGHASTAYYYLPSRFWELGAGALLLQAHIKGRLLPRTEAAQGRCAVGGMALLAASVAFANAGLFPFPWAVPAVLGTVLFISAAAASAELGKAKTPVLRFFALRPVVFVGQISYSLYLWHWPLIVLARWTFGLNSLTSYAVVVIASTVLATLSYLVVESPTKRMFRNVARPGLALALCLVGVYACQRIYRKIDLKRLSLSLSRTKGADWRMNVLPPEGLGAVAGRAWSDRNLLVVGDSHAAAYSDLLTSVNQNYGPHVAMYFRPGCWVANLRQTMAENDQPCRDFVTSSLNDACAKAKPGDLVFLASLRVDRLGEQWATFTEDARRHALDDPKAIADRAVSLQEADRILDRLDGTGATIVMDAPPTVFPSPPFRCADWYDRDNPVCSGGTAVSRRFFETWRRPTMEALAKLRLKHPRLVIWDPLDALCPSSECSAYDAKGLPLFFDGDHLSAHGNEVAYPSFVKMLSSVWGDPKS